MDDEVFEEQNRVEAMGEGMQEGTSDAKMEVDPPEQVIKRQDAETEGSSDSVSTESSIQPSRPLTAAERNILRAERRKVVFQRRLGRFEEYATLTKLKLTDCAWHGQLSVKTYPQKTPLCGYMYGYRDPIEQSIHDLNRVPMTSFHALTFYQRTHEILYAAGACPTYNEEIAGYIFERTMKTMVEYLNFMYEAAKRRRKQHITSVEFQELIWRNRTILQVYFKHFYPTVYNDDGSFVFHNEFSKLIHVAIHNSSEAREIYVSHEIFMEHLQQNSALFQLHFQYNPFTNLPALNWQFHQTYVSLPGGDQYSSFAANRFHEALGMPPLETDLITAIAWLAKQVIHRIVYETIVYYRNHFPAGLPNLQCYIDASAGKGSDHLFDLDFDVVDSSAPRQPEPFQLRERHIRDVEAYYPVARRLMADEEYEQDFYWRHCRTGMYYTGNEYKVVECARKR